MHDAASLIYHLATPVELAEAQERGSLAPASLATEGFIHCSTAAQLASTIERHYAGVAQLAVLHLDPVTLGDALVWEESRPGEVYPHVYREISIDEVVEIVPFTRELDDPPPTGG
jgi:uncharacterized protein (DUF952 family)